MNQGVPDSLAIVSRPFPFFRVPGAEGKLSTRVDAATPVADNQGSLVCKPIG